LTRKKPDIKLSDADFVKRLIELGCNQSSLAKELGITRQGINVRVRRLAPLIEQAKHAKDGAAIAAIVSRNIPREQIRAKSFAAGLEHAGRQYHIFDHLEDLYMDIKMLLEDVKKEVDEAREKKKPVKPYHIDQIVKLVNQSRTLITDAHRIKMELVQAKHIEGFINAVVSIMLQYDPSIREKIYVSLSGLGVEGQIALFTASSGPSAGSNGYCDKQT
jgi:hypothetical protein